MTTITQDTTLALAAGQQQRPDSNDIPGIIQALTAGGHDDTSAMEETPAGEVTSETTTSEEALTETALIDNALTEQETDRQGQILAGGAHGQQLLLTDLDE